MSSESILSPSRRFHITTSDSFEKKGVVPWLRLWGDIRIGGVKVVIIGLMVMVSTRFLYASSPFPTAGGLILNLIGALMVLQGAYAILTSGYLSDA